MAGAVQWGRRVATVAVGFPVVLWLLLHDQLCPLLLAAVALAGHREYVATIAPGLHRGMLHANDDTRRAFPINSRTLQAVQLVCGLLIVLAACASASQTTLDVASAAAIVVVAVVHLAQHGDKVPVTAATVACMTVSTFGLVLVPWNIARAIVLRNLPFGGALLAFYVLVVWNADNAAIVVGRNTVSWHPFPQVSPGKSIAGVVGGIVAASITAMIAAPAMGISQHATWSMKGAACHAVIGAALAVLGVAGDLVESVLKRGAGVKDSGNVIPGHGGILDRTDSLLCGVSLFLWAVQAGHILQAGEAWDETQL